MLPPLVACVMALLPVASEEQKGCWEHMLLKSRLGGEMQNCATPSLYFPGTSRNDSSAESCLPDCSSFRQRSCILGKSITSLDVNPGINRIPILTEYAISI